MYMASDFSDGEDGQEETGQCRDEAVQQSFWDRESLHTYMLVKPQTGERPWSCYRNCWNVCQRSSLCLTQNDVLQARVAWRFCAARTENNDSWPTSWPHGARARADRQTACCPFHADAQQAQKAHVVELTGAVRCPRKPRAAPSSKIGSGKQSAASSSLAVVAGPRGDWRGRLRGMRQRCCGWLARHVGRVAARVWMHLQERRPFSSTLL